MSVVRIGIFGGLGKSGKSLLYKLGTHTHIPPPMISDAISAAIPTIAAISWLSISIKLLLLVFVIVCLLMALLILMQRPKQEGLGAAFGGGVTDQVFGARTTNVLQKGTVYLGSMFFIIALTLAILIGKQNQEKTLLDPNKPDAEQASAGVVEEEVVEEEVPVEPTSLVEELPTEAVPEPPAGIPAEDAAEAAADAVEEIVEEVVEEPASDAPAAEPDAADKSE